MAQTKIEKKVKFSCQNLWKLFGKKCLSVLEKTNFAPSSLELSNANIIPAVQNINLNILEGEIFVIMGLSGSGKSTLIRCLSRLTEPTFGQIYFENSDLIKISNKELINLRRHKMAMVFQNFALLPHMSVLENILFPLEIQGMKKKEMNEKAFEVLELVGLNGRENYFPKELSGGQQQRVGIARSLAVNPEVWFLDEPFSSLDPLIRGEMQNEFLRIQSLLKKTIIFITHDFDEAIKLADRIAIMKDGKIIQVGTPEELVICPADDYVKEFTKDVVKSKVLTAKSIMSPNSKSDKLGFRINETDLVDQFSEKIIDDNIKALVVDSNGKGLGTIDKKIIIDLLMNRTKPASHNGK